MTTPLIKWLRGARTRRMFAQALGDSRDRPLQQDQAYVRMATQILDHVATHLGTYPWTDPSASWAAAAHEAGMLRQLERQLQEEQNPGTSVTVGPAATAWTAVRVGDTVETIACQDGLHRFCSGTGMDEARRTVQCQCSCHHRGPVPEPLDVEALALAMHRERGCGHTGESDDHMDWHRGLAGDLADAYAEATYDTHQEEP